MGKRLRPPREPGPDECCGSGCTRCVWDVYYDELAKYNEMRLTSSNSESDDGGGDDDSSWNDDSSSEHETNFIGSVVIELLQRDDPKGSSSKCTFAQEDMSSRYTELESSRLLLSSNHGADTNESTVNVISLKPVVPLPSPYPGDVVEIFVPNDVDGVSDSVGELCKRMGVDPNALCMLRKSPFVPEDNFPPWLPLRKAMTIRELLTYYVDISSCSYLLRPTFFQSLLRVYSMDPRTSTSVTEDMATPELLKECASVTEGPKIFKDIMNHGSPLCYPSLVDVLDAFPFVQLPIERMLEISAPLHPRKFSIAGVELNTEGKLTSFDLCMRKLTVARSENLRTTHATAAAQKLARILNGIAERRTNRGGSPSRFFHGHVSFPLCERAQYAHERELKTEKKAYVGSSLFGTSVFCQELKKAVATLTYSKRSAPFPVLLIGAGTGIAPLMAAVQELVRIRCALGVNGETTPSFSCNVWYGARTKDELLYNDILTAAVSCKAIESYQHALSRDTVAENSGPTPPKYVTDLLQTNVGYVKKVLTESQGCIFACGPTKVLSALRRSLQTILAESDDDEGTREQRVLLLEEKNKLLFDVWSTVKEF